MATTPREPRKDGESTRTRILEAAGELFAEHGYGETSNKAVAARAEVDLASINYHFGSRNGLYQAVLTEARRRFVDIDELRRITQGALPGTAKLQALIDLLVQQATEERQGWHLRVLAAEVLAPSTHAQVLMPVQGNLKMTLLKGLFSEITAIPADDPALTRCVLSVTAPWAMLLMGPRRSHGTLQQILEMPREAVAAHLYSFTLAGLREIGRQYAQRQDDERA